VQATIDFLSENDFPSSLIKPLRDLVGDLIDISKPNRRMGKPGRTSIPHNEKVKAAQATAAVTLLRRKNESLDRALKMVCKASGFEVKWLRQFRQNVLRGKGREAQFFYKSASMCFERASEAELLKVLHSRVVSQTPSFFNI